MRLEIPETRVAINSCGPWGHAVFIIPWLVISISFCVREWIMPCTV